MSLATQARAIRDYCERNGWKLDRIFEDAGESAKTAQRPALVEMVEYCRKAKGSVKFAVVYKLDRFARQALDHQVVQNMLLRYGVSLRSTQEPIDETPSGMLMANIVSAFAQFDNDTRAFRTREGMKATLQRGRWTFKEPLGYARRGSGPSAMLIPDETIAPHIREAFALVATQCYSAAEVLRIVTAKGLRGRNGKPLSPSRFLDLLKKPLYAGIVDVESMGVVAEGDFAPIVDRETFERAQTGLRLRGGKSVLHARDNPEFPLRRFVRCAHCNTPLTGSFSQGRSKRYAYYSCRNTACRGVKVPRATLETAFITFVEGLAPRQDFIELFRAIVVDTWRQLSVASAEAMKSAERRIADLKERKRLLVETFVYRQAIEKEVYAEENARLDDALAVAAIELNEIRSEELDIDAVLNFANHVLTNAARLWLEFDGERRRRLQSVLFPDGVVFDGEEFRTEATVCIFNDIREISSATGGLASPTGFEPVSSP